LGYRLYAPPESGREEGGAQLMQKKVVIILLIGIDQLVGIGGMRDIWLVPERRGFVEHGGGGMGIGTLV